MPRHTPENCPVCGADLAPSAKACPDCGADDRSGWNENDSYLDGVDLPPEPSEKTLSTKTKPLWLAIAVLLLVAIVCAILGLR